jgi:hypothetical protein
MHIILGIEVYFKLFGFPTFDIGRLFKKRVGALNVICTFYYYHWVDTSAGELLVPEGIGTLKVERLENKIILKVLGASKPKGLNRITKIG